MNQIFELHNESIDSTESNPSTLNFEPEDKAVETADFDLRYGFRLGEYGLLLPESAKAEVVANPEIYPIPNTIEWMRGLISVRGSFASVFDLGTMLDLGLKTDQRSVMVLNLKGDLIAFPFDSADSLELPPSVSENDPNLPASLSQFAGNVYQTGQEFWIEFDFKTCLELFASQISQ